MQSTQEIILIYTPQSSRRLSYVLEIFFQRIVSIAYRQTEQEEEFQQYTGPKIGYASTLMNPANELFIPYNGILQDNSPLDDFVVEEVLQQLRVHFMDRESRVKHFTFDIWAASFLLLVQYELYQQQAPRDELGRLQGGDSQLARLGLLERPVVDELCLELIARLQQCWPGMTVGYPAYQFTPTYDIDITWAFGHRSLFRQAAATARDLIKANWEQLRLRYRVYRGREQDPFDSFAFLDALHQEWQLRPIYFFLLGDYGGLDRNIHHAHLPQRQRFYQLAQKYLCGLHPSIGSNKSRRQLAREVSRFRVITGQEVRHSRQHYLVLQLPTTYRQLLAQGIRHEYSLGFADRPGFRAGIARPFPWYDLEQEQSTELMLHPFLIMDQALRRAGDQDHRSLMEKTLSFAQQAKAVNGQVYTLWHNSSFSQLGGWLGWQDHYTTLIQQFIADDPPIKRTE